MQRSAFLQCWWSAFGLSSAEKSFPAIAADFPASTDFYSNTRHLGGAKQRQTLDFNRWSVYLSTIRNYKICSDSRLLSQHRREEKLDAYMEIWRIYILLIVAVLMMGEPHLSGTIPIVGTGVVLTIVGGMHWKWISIELEAMAVAVVSLIIGVFPYGQSRTAMVFWQEWVWERAGRNSYTCQRNIMTSSLQSSAKDSTLLARHSFLCYLWQRSWVAIESHCRKRTVLISCRWWELFHYFPYKPFLMLLWSPDWCRLPKFCFHISVMEGPLSVCNCLKWTLCFRCPNSEGRLDYKSKYFREHSCNS